MTIEFISHLLIEDLLYGRYCEFLQELRT